MNTVVRIACIFAMAVVGTAAQQKSLVAPRDFIMGADISGVQAAEARGVKYSDKGVKKDILAILKDHSNGNGQALFDTTGAVIPEKMASYDK